MNRKLKARIIEFYGTQSDFAERIEENESVVSRVVRARKSLTFADRKRWAEALNCSVAELFNGQKDRVNEGK